ncbi:MAG: DUF3105 domain-containing protein [Candidatus Wildermuthbacteria bacterium]|nr:DUF3105 domain-containing protein [Candidatus Wildermuthbacteria bacterium]
MNEQITKQEKREIRRQEKETEQRARQSNRFVGRIRNYAIIFGVIALVGYGLYLLAQSSAPKEEDFSRAIPLMGANHIAAGSQLPEYTSNPPTSGPHYGQTARSGFREEAIPDQNIIHNLEHGDVWIAFHPRIADEIQEELKQFGAAKVIITPREANETDIALAAWGRLDAFNVENNVLPVERIKDFIKRYTNKGPEKVPGASGGI